MIWIAIITALVIRKNKSQISITLKNKKYGLSPRKVKGTDRTPSKIFGKLIRMEILKFVFTLKYEVFGRFSVIAVIKDAKTKRAVNAPINLKF